MKNREALVLGLFYLGEQRIADIAAITNMTEGHVKTTLHRARNNFRDGLRQLLGHETNQLL